MRPKAFIERLQGQWDVINEYTTNEILKKQTNKKALAQKIKDFHDLKKNGQISEDIYNAELARLLEKFDDCHIEIAAHSSAENETFRQGLKIIELLESAKKFMELDGNWLEKVKLAKMVLSNPTMKDGTLEFHYQTPFYDLLLLTDFKNWWRLPK